MSLSSHIGLVSVALLGGLAVAQGCVAEPEPFNPPEEGGDGGSGGGSSTGGQGGETAAENFGQQMFAELEADFAASCESSCHGGSGIANTPFLAGPDRYKSVTSWPGIIRTDWEQSLLLTHAKTGAGHSGPNLDGPDNVDTLLPLIEAWLEEEAKGIIEQPSETVKIEPFAPIIGFNAVYLDTLDPSLAGQSLTFDAELITPTTLKLTSLQIQPAATLGAHIVHPLFVVHPVAVDPDPDPADSFSNVEVYVEPAVPTPLGPGVLLLTNWQENAKVSVAFQLIESYEGDPNNPLAGGCKAVDDFIQNAEPALQQNCVNCHGNAGSNAASAVDMTEIGGDSAAACAQILNRVSLDDPPSSQLFITTDPGGNAAHPFKFNGNQGNFANFRDDVSLWIEAEAIAPPPME